VQIVRTKSILETAEALKHCHAFISVDTALMHLAAAVKVSRQIVIEAPTFNKTNEPYNQRYFLAQNPMLIGKNKLDFYRYDGRDIQGTREELLAIMNSITADQVFAVLDQALSSEPL
jgi:ADP-heptose:LPS heptosyltransferase